MRLTRPHPSRASASVARRSPHARGPGGIGRRPAAGSVWARRGRVTGWPGQTLGQHPQPFCPYVPVCLGQASFSFRCRPKLPKLLVGAPRRPSPVCVCLVSLLAVFLPTRARRPPLLSFTSRRCRATSSPPLPLPATQARGPRIDCPNRLPWSPPPTGLAACPETETCPSAKRASPLLASHPFNTHPLPVLHLSAL
jgi:hypothetical protein